MRLQYYWVLIFSIVSLTIFAIHPSSAKAKKIDKNITENINYLRQSYLLEKDKKYLNSLKFFLKHKSKNPFFYHIRLGWLYYLNDRIGNSVKHYQKAITLEPHSTDAHLGLVNCYVYTKKYSSAREVLLSVRKWAPSNIVILEKLALIYYYEGDKNSQLKTVKKLLDYYPTTISYLNQAGFLTRELGQEKQAIKYFAKVRTIVPQSYYLHLQEKAVK